MARVLIVDDHPVVRRGLAQLINQAPDMEVCGEAGTVRGAREAIAKTKPDVAIIDLSLKDASGLELVKDLKAQYPKLPVLVLSMHDESLYAERALRAGAKGYIMKEEAPEEVMTALRSVLTGRAYLSERTSARLIQRLATGPSDVRLSPIGTLSDRELEVFELIGRGLTTGVIAEKLCLSVKTVETHRENIKRKLELQDTHQLHRHAFLWVQGKSTHG